jgi:hypothetical protein
LEQNNDSKPKMKASMSKADKAVRSSIEKIIPKGAPHGTRGKSENRA